MGGSRGQPPPQLTGLTQSHVTASSQAAARQGVGVRSRAQCLGSRVLSVTRGRVANPPLRRGLGGAAGIARAG